MLSKLLRIFLILLVCFFIKSFFYSRKFTQTEHQNNINFSDNLYSNYLKAYYSAKELKFEDTGNYFLNVVKLSNEKSLIMDSLICLILGGKADKVIHLINEYKLENKNYYLALISTLNKFKNGHFNQKEEISDILLQEDELNLTHILQAWIKFDQGLINEATHLLNKIINDNLLNNRETFTNQNDTIMQLALMYDLNNDKENAKIYYDKLLSNTSSAVDTLIISNFYERHNYSSIAQEIKTDFHNKNPLNFLFFRKNSQNHNNSKVRIINNSREALSYHIITLGDFLINNFNTKIVNQSLFYYQMAKFLSDLPFANLAITQILVNYGNLDTFDNLNEALSLTQNIQDTNKQIDYWKNFRLAEIYFKLQLHNQAQTILKKLIQANPLMFDSYMFLSDIYKKNHSYEKVIELYDNYIKNLNEIQNDFPENIWFLYLMRGEAYDMLGNHQKAAFEYEKALKIKPNHPSILNNLAYNWLEQKQNFNEAEDLLLKAYSIQPKDPAILDSLAWCYYLKGDYLKAEKYSEKSVDFLPTDPITNEHLGDIYYKLGRTTEACYQWNYALQCIDISETAIERIRNKIYQLD